MTMQDLDALLSEARATETRPAPDFLARVLDDAYAAQPAPAAGDAVARPGGRSLLALLAGWVGGFGGAAAGLATATLAGIWLGFAQPAALSAPVASVSAAFGAETAVDDVVELIPSLDGWLAEG